MVVVYFRDAASPVSHYSSCRIIGSNCVNREAVVGENLVDLVPSCEFYLVSFGLELSRVTVPIPDLAVALRAPVRGLYVLRSPLTG